MYALTTLLQQSCSLCKRQCDLEILNSFFFPPLSTGWLCWKTGNLQLAFLPYCWGVWQPIISSHCEHICNICLTCEQWGKDALIVTEWERRLLASWSVGVKMVLNGMPRVLCSLLGSVFLCTVSVWWKKLWAAYLTSIGVVSVTVPDKMLFFCRSPAFLVIRLITSWRYSMLFLSYMPPCPLCSFF